ncbi:MAG: stage II sporulation protein M [Propionibacteriaceae bacterium]|nr:stage II sporulation protein M [Propionibacteriaceae bacterium]
MSISALFWHNLLLFTAISLLPVINSLITAVQFFMIGVIVSSIATMPFMLQVMMVYRHGLFEVTALLLAVTVSYILLFSLTQFSSSESRDITNLRRGMMLSLSLYSVIILLTLVGAILEGTVVVQV